MMRNILLLLVMCVFGAVSAVERSENPFIQPSSYVSQVKERLHRLFFYSEEQRAEAGEKLKQLLLDKEALMNERAQDVSPERLQEINKELKLIDAAIHAQNVIVGHKWSTKKRLAALVGLVGVGAGLFSFYGLRTPVLDTIPLSAPVLDTSSLSGITLPSSLQLANVVGSTSVNITYSDGSKASYIVNSCNDLPVLKNDLKNDKVFDSTVSINNSTVDQYFITCCLAKNSAGKQKRILYIELSNQMFSKLQLMDDNFRSLCFLLREKEQSEWCEIDHPSSPSDDKMKLEVDWYKDLSADTRGYAGTGNKFLVADLADTELGRVWLSLDDVVN